jgi:hypothetical protein
MKMRCDDCTRSFDDQNMMMAPMLHDRVWGRLAHEDETLCGSCMFKRAADRGIKLRLADLAPCPFNLWGAPFFNWFKFFAEDESKAPKNLMEWEKALQRLSPILLQWTAALRRAIDDRP